MDKEAIRLLIIEDSATDKELLVAELKRAQLVFTHQCVCSKADFLAALKMRQWDAIISDYALPQFSGPEALRLIRSQGLSLPFIMVSGIYGEEEAVAMMKAGANDYVMKANLGRLAPALERELQAAEDRRRNKRAEGAMQFLASLVESSGDAIYGKNLQGLIVSWNPAAERMFGYATEEIIGQSTSLLVPKAKRKEIQEILEKVRKGDIVADLETERRHKTGQIIPVAVTVSPIRDGSGEIMGASSIVRDMTRQKRAEAERQLLIQELTAAAKKVRMLTGLLPICATCKRVRDDEGYWEQVDTYVSRHSTVTFTHSICPDCAAKYEKQFGPRDK
jgi:sigma-B regulation protein RsbU (phosphoserine phosphatase)